MCLGFLLSQPQKYKRIISKAVKVFTSCTSVEQNLFKQIVIGDTVLPQFIVLVQKLLCLCTVKFCDQESFGSLLWDELTNFVTKNLFQLVIEVTYQDPYNWLVTYWEPCIEMRNCHYRTSPIEYWDKGSTVCWYKVLRFL